jgi:hypothetical protein
MKSKLETRSIQIWPGGRSLTYRGEGDAMQTRPGQHWEKGRWRKASKADRRAIRIEELAARYQRNEILCLDSSLVTDLMQLSGKFMDDDGGILSEWSADYVSNPTPDPSDWDIEECREWLEEHVMGNDMPASDADEDEWRDAVREHATDAEIYEWYRVTDWLSRQLNKIGECVLDNAYGQWWGRQCTGQALIMDGTLQRIAAGFVGEGGE